MAAIDKTYVTKEQLLNVYEWAKSVGEVTLENGHVFKPIDFICYYDMNNLPELDEYVLWNTPTWFDRWLWKNCPLAIVLNRLAKVYDDKTLQEFDFWSYDEQVPEKRKYKVIEVPTGKNRKSYMRCARYKNPWPGKCIQATYEINIGPAIKNSNGELVIDSLNAYAYDEQTDTWGPVFGMLPYYDDYVWQKHHKNIPCKKTILRLIRKWNIPKGYMVHVSSLRYLGIDYKIIVK